MVSVEDRDYGNVVTKVALYLRAIAGKIPYEVFHMAIVFSFHCMVMQAIVKILGIRILFMSLLF